MQSFYAATFDREMGCTEAEWLAWLPQALGHHRWRLQPGRADVWLGEGNLQLSWQLASPRRIGQISIPVMRVSFMFEQLDADGRYAFMQRFDLYMQRGGG